MNEEASPNAPKQRSPNKLLVDWANQQDHWLRGMLGELITTGKALPQSRIDHFYKFLLIEKGLKDGDAFSHPTIGDAGEAEQATDKLTLTTIKDVKNVNKLSEGQEIALNPRMTVLFGENATGKTGYVRIIKKVASVRTEEPILPNIEATTPVPPPSAQIGYKLGENTETVYDWQDQSGVHPFTRIDVFDANSALVHVDDDLTYLYTPRELSLYRLAADAIEAVKGKLQEAKNDTASKGNPFLSHFSRESSVYGEIETLGPSTDLAKLDTLAVVTEEEEASLQKLRDTVEALRSKTADSKLMLAQGERDLYQSAKDIFSTVGKFDQQAYNAALQALATARAAHEEATTKAFEGDDIPGVLTDSWKTLVEAAEEHIVATETETYPQQGHSCVFCRQPLSDAALQLVTKYRAYCNDQSRKAAEAAQSSLTSLAQDIVALDVAPLTDAIQKKVKSYQKEADVPPLQTKIASALNEVAAYVKVVDESKPSVDDTLFATAGQLETETTKTIAELDGLIDGLQKQSTDRHKVLAQEQAKLANLEGRLKLREHLAQIKEHVQNAKWADKASTIIRRFQPVNRSLTETAKLASEQLLNDDFKKLFEEECKVLKAPAVRLDFPGRRGEPARRKSLSNGDHKLSAVLSEGEQKVIALADFIAEALLRQVSSPVALDDPVTSLDYKRLEHVVDRLVELSQTRQVIVFTHNIWFTTEILSRFQADPSKCFYYQIAEGDSQKGVITRGTHPRADKISSTTKRINGILQSAKSQTGESQEALIERAYGLMRNVCEVIVEQELLQGVTQRYQPNVMMTRLPQIRTDRLDAAVQAIEPIFEKCCRVIPAHSQPLETLNTRPTLEDAEKDWQAIQDARKAYIA